MKALIMAAGYATRLYPLTLDRPKALLPIAGKPIIGYILDEINTIPDIDKVYVVTNSKFYKHFCDWANGLSSGKPVEIIDDGTSTEETRLGGVGDIKFVIDRYAIDDDLMIIAGDNFFTYRLADYFAEYEKNPCDYVVAKEIDDVRQLRQFAVAELDADNRILNLIEKPSEPPSNIAVFATYTYRRDTLPLFERYFREGNNPDAPGYFVQWLHKIKPVYAWRMNGDCYDIGTQKAYDDIRAAFEKRLRKEGKIT
jgi:glucose-1-phosphate thymidylyltransferase